MAGTKSVSQGKRFRNLIEAPAILVMPGAWDGLSARLIEQAGFDGVYISGGAIARQMILSSSHGRILVRFWDWMTQSNAGRIASRQGRMSSLSKRHRLLREDSSVPTTSATLFFQSQDANLILFGH